MQELEIIRDLTPDYQNINFDSSWYEAMAEEKGWVRGGLLVMWNDFVDSVEIFTQLNMAEPSKNKRVETEVKKIFKGSLNKESISNYIGLVKKTISYSQLKPEIINKETTEKLLYHGTGSQALKGIIKYDSLISEKILHDMGEKPSTGEGWHERKPWLHTDVFLTESVSNATKGHACGDGIVYFKDFPVVIGFPKQVIKEYARQTGGFSQHFDPEYGELLIKDKIPLALATHIFAPEKRLPEVGTNLKKTPIEYLFKEMPRHHRHKI